MQHERFIGLQELSDINDFKDIPRTCFFFGSQDKIAHMIIPVIDHMHDIMIKVMSHFN